MTEEKKLEPETPKPAGAPDGTPTTGWPLSSQLVPVAFLGVLFAGAVLWYGHGWWLGPPPNDNGEEHLERWTSRTFLTSGRGLLWSSLIVVECAVWFALIAVSFGSKNLAPKDNFASPGEMVRMWFLRVVAYSLLFFALIAPLFYPDVFVEQGVSQLSPLRFHGQKMLALIVPAALAATCVVARIRDVERATPRILHETDLQYLVTKLGDANSNLRHALAALALMLSLNVFATAALLHALHPLMSDAQRVAFGTEMVLAFGGAYTVIAIAFYLPVYFTLSEAQAAAARTLAEKECPDTGTVAGLVAWREAESKWVAALGLERDWVASLQAGFGLLAPMFAALVSLLLPSK